MGRSVIANIMTMAREKNRSFQSHLVTAIYRTSRPVSKMYGGVVKDMDGERMVQLGP